MGSTQRILIFLALLFLPLIFFMYNHSVSILSTHFRHAGIVQHVPNNSSQSFHMQLLSHYDKAAFDGCRRLAGVESEKGSCHFMNQTLRLPVALASFQGSGSTWVRGLLEQATGICTGSVYCDPWLRASGFSGENVRSGAVIVTKTHYPVFIEGIVVLFSNVAAEDHNMLNLTEDIMEHSEIVHSTEGSNETTTTLNLTEEIKKRRRLYATKNLKEDPKTLPLTESNKGSTSLHLTEDLKTLHFTEGTNKDRKIFNATKGIEENPERLYAISSNSTPRWGYVHLKVLLLEWSEQGRWKHIKKKFVILTIVVCYQVILR